MKVIGFASQFYTLWNVGEFPQYEMVNGQHVHVGTRYTYNYIQNLSMNEEEAIRKVSERYGIENPEVDESLRGISTRSFEKYERKPLPFTVFPFGKLKWCDIESTNDVYQLKRVYFDRGGNGGSSESFLTEKRRMVLARRKLIQLGELVRCDNVVNEYIVETDENVEVKRKYMTLRDYNQKLKAESSEYLHKDGERLDLRIQRVNTISYDTVYGTTYIVTYNDEAGLEYIYKGGRPPYLKGEGFHSVKATIKHNEYRGIKQTLIQRIKAI